LADDGFECLGFARDDDLEKKLEAVAPETGHAAFKGYFAPAKFWPKQSSPFHASDTALAFLDGFRVAGHSPLSMSALAMLGKLFRGDLVNSMAFIG